VSKLEICFYILKHVGLHLVRRWYIYATFVTILVAPFPVVLAVGLVWLGYIWYRVGKQKSKDVAWERQLKNLT
jgi:hypothetical protein